MAAWYSIKPLTKEKHAPCYASKGAQGYVRFSNGAYVAFCLTVEEARSRYKITSKCSKEVSDRVESRFDWEMGR